MLDIILTFGMCNGAVIHDGSTFKNVFIAMCFVSKIHYWCLSRGNHQGNLFEHYHRFLNKTQTISGNDRGTNKLFIDDVKRG